MGKIAKNLAGIATGLAVGSGSVSNAEHYNIIIASGQSNARLTWANGFFDEIVASGRFESPILYHRNHSGNWMNKWIDGTPGNYVLGPNTLEDFWSPDETSGLQQLIQSIETNGDTWDISGFSWFQGEGDTGSPYQRSLYKDRFLFLLNEIEDKYNLGHDIPFVVTAIDYNGDDQALADIGRTPQDVEDMRNVHFEIGAGVPYGVTYDSRGWPRLDLWHVGSHDDPRGIYGPVYDLGGEEAQMFLDLPTDLNRSDLNGDGLRDLQDISLFVDWFINHDPRGDLAPPADVYDLADVSEFIDSFIN